MFNKKKSLTAEELLKNVYRKIQKFFDGQDIALPQTARAVIAHDMKYNWTRLGYSCYDLASLAKVRNKKWVIAFGLACGSYPADYFDCDIAAINLVDKKRLTTAMSAHRLLKNNSYFINSLVYSLKSGLLRVNQRGVLGKAIVPIINFSQIERFFFRRFQAEPYLFDRDGNPVIKKSALYKVEFEDLLVEAFCRVIISLS
jgi:hypothetical protein